MWGARSNCVSGVIRFGLAGRDVLRVSRGALGVWPYADRGGVKLLIVDISSGIFRGQILVLTLSSSCEIMCNLFPVSRRLLLLLGVSLNRNFEFEITSVTLILLLFFS